MPPRRIYHVRRHASPLHDHSHPHTAIKHLTRPHTNSVDIHVTPFELLILLFAIGILVALLCWLAWICLESCMAFIQEKYDEVTPRRNAERSVHQAEQVVKFFTKVGMDLGRATKGFLIGLGRKNQGENEQRGKLIGERSGGLYEGLVGGFGDYGRRGERIFGDGTSGSTSTGHTTVVHREDCEGACGVQSRRRSAESQG